MEIWKATHRPGGTMEAYEAACECGSPDSGLALAQVAAHECAAAATEASTSMRFDPGQPGLEEAYYLLMDELSSLATIFAVDDQLTVEYAAVCCGIDALLASSREAKPTWTLLRALI